MGALALIPEEIEDALLAMIATGGSPTRAHALLKAAGKRAPAVSTLHGLPTRHQERYLELQTARAPQMAERIAGAAEALTITYSDLQAQIAERMANELHQIDTKELSGAARNLATAAALNVDKLASPLRGRPTVIHANEDPRDVADKLLRSMGIPTVESTATDLEPIPTNGSAEPAPEPLS